MPLRLFVVAHPLLACVYVWCVGWCPLFSCGFLTLDTERLVGTGSLVGTGQLGWQLQQALYQATCCWNQPLHVMHLQDLHNGKPSAGG